MQSETLAILAKHVPWNSVPWFDLLDRIGLFERWLNSGSPDQLQYVLGLFCAPNITRERSDKVAKLIRPALEGRGERRQEILKIFHFGEIHHSQEMFGLFLQLFDEGAFDSGAIHPWTFSMRLSEADPRMGVQLIAHSLDRLTDLAAAAHFESPFDTGLQVGWLPLPEDIIESAATGDPAAFVQNLLPRVASLIVEHPLSSEDGRVLDTIWPYLSLGIRHDFRSYLFEALWGAMETLAGTNPHLLDEATRDLQHLPHQNIVALLLGAWAANGAVFADRIAEYILAAPDHRLDIGYSSWGAGNGIAAISRRAIGNASSYCSEINFKRLERAILNFSSPFEKQEPGRIGYKQYLLLNSLVKRRFSKEATKRLNELARKFPNVDLELPTAVLGAGFVGSPIPETAAQKMNDEQWLSAMRSYPNAAGRPDHKNFLKGGALELSQQLEREVKKDKPRFAELALRMEADVQPIYFDAILRGIVASDESEKGDLNRVASPIPTLLAAKVIRHVYELFGASSGREIAHAVGQLAEREIPDDLLKIVADLARNASDPERELWRPSGDNKPFYGGDPLSHGINTTRGAAARAMALLLFADDRRFDLLKDAILSVVSDSSAAVRACAVECLVAMLNFEEEQAVQLFLALVQEEEAILGTFTIENFLYHACFSHYAVLRALLLRMLTSTNADIRETAARLIAVASFKHEEAKTDLVLALEADEVCRKAIANVDAENLRLPTSRPASRLRLKKFFSDESSEVRLQAALCFSRISDEQLGQESELIEAFIQSPAFQKHANLLLRALKDSAARLPDVVCRIAERATEIHRNNENREDRWWTGDMAALVLRVQEQTEDPQIKRRCLDVIDSMIELDFGGVTVELGKLEG